VDCVCSCLDGGIAVNYLDIEQTMMVVGDDGWVGGNKYKQVYAS